LKRSGAEIEKFSDPWRLVLSSVEAIFHCSYFARAGKPTDLVKNQSLLWHAKKVK
jgi:hypothetical protein